MVARLRVTHRLNSKRSASRFRRLALRQARLPPELVELFVEVKHALALTATSAKTKIMAIAGRFEPQYKFDMTYYK